MVAGRRVSYTCRLLLFAGSLLAASPVGALDVKLWPLIDYHSAPSGERCVHLRQHVERIFRIGLQRKSHLVEFDCFDSIVSGFGQLARIIN